MAEYILKDALVEEIDRRIADNKKDIKRASHKNLEDYFEGYEDGLTLLKQQFLDTLEVKEVIESKLPNPRFPHLDNIVDKVFGAGNLESFEYEEAEQLVLLAKEELLKDLEVKEVDLNRELDDYIEKEKAWIKYDRSVEYYNGDSFNHIYDLRELAEHFFELGLQVSNKARKGEKI